MTYGGFTGGTVIMKRVYCIILLPILGIGRFLFNNTVTVGTRGSKLALIQTESVVELLRKAHARCEFTTSVIKTLGDREKDAGLTQIGGQGVFIKELEESLLAGTIDMAVHSLKDMPSQLQPGLKIGAVLKRGDARDVLVSGSGAPLAELPGGAIIGTGSHRRAVQITAARPDLRIIPIRGNVDTRLKKVYSKEVDAIVIAAAALERLGWVDRITEYLDPDICLPAVGQGALAIEIRDGEKETEELVAAVHDTPTSQATTAERFFLDGLGGGCRAPIGAYATVNGHELELEAMVGSLDGFMIMRDKIKGLAEAAGDAGYLLAARLLGMGAGRYL